MATVAGQLETLADLWDRLGRVPLERIRLRPPPGMATERDVLEAEARTGRLCELIDGVLVEKTVGFRESLLAVALVVLLKRHADRDNLGLVTGTDGTIRLFPGQVRIPDVAYFSWARIPGGKVPEEPIPDLAPDLAVEVLSPSNTRGEMERKLADYFASGVRLVWYVDPRNRTVIVHRADDGSSTRLEARETLDGGDVLPGFEPPLSDLFADLDRTGG